MREASRSPCSEADGKCTCRCRFPVGGAEESRTGGAAPRACLCLPTNHLEEIQGLLSAPSRPPHRSEACWLRKGRLPCAQASLAPWFCGPAFTPSLGHWHKSGKHEKKANFQMSPFPLLPASGLLHILSEAGAKCSWPRRSRRCVAGCEPRHPEKSACSQPNKGRWFLRAARKGCLRSGQTFSSGLTEYN